VSEATEDLERRFISLIEQVERGRTDNLIPFGNAMGPIAWVVGYLMKNKDAEWELSEHHWSGGFVTADGKPEPNDDSPATCVLVVGWTSGEVVDRSTYPHSLDPETIRAWLTIGVGQTKAGDGIRTVWPETFGNNAPGGAEKEWAKVDAPDRFKVSLEAVCEWLGPELLAVVEENLPAYRYCSQVRSPRGHVTPDQAWRDVNVAIVNWGESGHGFNGLTSASGRSPKCAFVLEPVRKPPKPVAPVAPPAEFWRAVFLDQKIDFSIPADKRPVPVDLRQRPSGFMTSFQARPALIEEKRYLGSIKVVAPEGDDTRRAEDDSTRRAMREFVMANGPGTYDYYDTLDEAGEKPVSARWRWRNTFSEVDIEGMRLYPPENRLSDEEVADLEGCLQKAIEIGNAVPAERLAIEYRRRGLHKDVLRVTVAGMRAPDHDHGIWGSYDEGAKPLRNIQRRLMSMHNLSAPLGGSLYDTVDCGEADPKRECAKCGKSGALNADEAFSSLSLCHTCRKLPRSEWPSPKPIAVTMFTGFKAFKKAGET